MLDLIFPLLASYSVLTCALLDLPDGKVERLYGLAPLCKFLVKNKDGIAPLNLFNQNRVVYYLKDVILEGGIPFNKIFNQATSNHSTIMTKKILETYNGFKGLKTVVHVRGGIVAMLSMIVAK
ncbi:hypothetical protein EUGRSUZ_A01394 [Eucalyptus grandis]|uniref:O-methyltransferase C-terminal domain-containing protein n=2 Tax=Eucalyptus grandis TaxID=71139 RepID=A0A059DF86_EUCGR|nr:hypothetical protein EUGRSUZ_A01394 [Eucalyptus grandis]